MTIENGIEKADKIAENKAETSGTLTAKVEAAARLARPAHFEIASKIMKEKILLTLQETDEVHSYESGVYKPGAQFFIRKKTMELMSNDCVRNFRTEVLDDIRVWTYHPLSEFDVDPLLINLHNGILDPRTGVVTEHKPDYFSLSQLDIVYDPKAQAPNFLAVMEEILPDAYSRQRAIDHFASCLLRRPLKKAFFGIGDTDSGKTLFSQIIAQFLGPRNVSNVAVQELEDKFATYRLVGKLCNMYADVDEKAIKQTSRFKTVTGADTIEVQRKGGQLFEYAPYCKHFYFGNRIPETKDLSDAFFNRWDIVKFLEKFTDDPSEEDPRQHQKRNREELLSTIRLEHSGILNILLARVLEINRLGAIPNSMSADDVRELWFYHSDYISQFLHDCTEKEPLSEVHQSKLYKAYTEFCVKKKTTPRLVKTFDQRIRAFGYMDGDVHERGQDGERGKHIKTWRGMALKASLFSEMSQKSVGSMGSVGAASPQSESKPIQPIQPIENSPIFQNKIDGLQEEYPIGLSPQAPPSDRPTIKNGRWVKLKDEWMIQCDTCHQFHCDKQEILDGHHKKCPAIYCPRCDTNYGSPNVLTEHNRILHKEGQH